MNIYVTPINDLAVVDFLSATDNGEWTVAEDEIMAIDRIKVVDEDAGEVRPDEERSKELKTHTHSWFSATRLSPVTTAIIIIPHPNPFTIRFAHRREAAPTLSLLPSLRRTA